MASTASKNKLVLLRNAIVNINGIKRMKNALRHDLLTFAAHRSSLKTVPSLVLGLANAKKKNNIKNM